MVDVEIQLYFRKYSCISKSKAKKTARYGPFIADFSITANRMACVP